jgi:hypothetical protein
MRWMLDVLGPNANRLGERRRIEVGLDDAHCRRGVKVLRTALAHGPLARRQIRERVLADGVLREPVGQSLIHLLFHAASLGVICCGPRMGRDDSFVLLDDWVPQSEAPRGDLAVAELARRYLAAYGPASVADFAAWSGLPVPAARAGWAAIAGEIVEFPGAIAGVWMLRAPSPDRASTRPVVRLLGHFDTFLLGYKRRVHLGDDAAEAWIHTGGGGWIRPVVTVDGWIVAGWRLDRVTRGFEITVTPFERLSGRMERGIEREAASIAAFLDSPVRWNSETLVV